LYERLLPISFEGIAVTVENQNQTRRNQDENDFKAPCCEVEIAVARNHKRRAYHVDEGHECRNAQRKHHAGQEDSSDKIGQETARAGWGGCHAPEYRDESGDDERSRRNRIVAGAADHVTGCQEDDADSKQRSHLLVDRRLRCGGEKNADSGDERERDQSKQHSRENLCASSSFAALYQWRGFDKQLSQSPNSRCKLFAQSCHT